MVVVSISSLLLKICSRKAKVRLALRWARAVPLYKVMSPLYWARALREAMSVERGALKRMLETQRLWRSGRVRSRCLGI